MPQVANAAPFDFRHIEQWQLPISWNEPSIRFYRSMGAEPMDEWTTYRITGDALTSLAAKGEQA